MVNWKADLESLVEETMRYTRSIETPLPRAVVEPDRKPAVNWLSTEREEIRQRVANFRAHQERLMREREDYAASQWRRTLLEPNSVR
jgi:hypothetical protein